MDLSESREARFQLERWQTPAMSMPGKGNKHHHMPHHHQQQHHPQQQQQQLHQASHVVNVNVNQTGVTHTPQYNTVVAANQRFVPHAGEFLQTFLLIFMHFVFIYHPLFIDKIFSISIFFS